MILHGDKDDDSDDGDDDDDDDDHDDCKCAPTASHLQVTGGFG